MRLTQFLQRCGVASRRACAEVVRKGEIAIDGEVITDLTIAVDPEKMEVTHQGKKLSLPTQDHQYYLLNKPTGFICSNASGKRNVLNLVPQGERPLFTCGRLDKETSGLLIITSDGDFCQKIIHPKARIAKEYVAKVSEWVLPRHLEAMQKGCMVQGQFVRPDSVKKVRKNTIKVVLHQGKKHEVRKIIASAGLDTLTLTRVRIGGLQLGSIPTGHYKLLGKKQLDQIFGS